MTIGARQAVIMATGGYARDKEFMKHEVPFLEHTLNSCSEGATSGALKSMIRAGARPVQLSLYRFSFALPTEDLIWGIAIDPSTGKRYASESLGRNPISTASLSVMAKSNGGRPFIIWDENGIKKFHNMSRVARSLNGLNGRNGTIYTFKTLDEVAAFYKTDANKLKATIAEYNKMIASGKDTEFNKPLTRSERKVEPISENGLFYTALMIPRWDYCPGGIVTDLKSRALTLADSKPMPGLFVVGEAAGGIHGAERLTGCSMPDCCVTGMLAGETAAALEKKAF